MTGAFFDTNILVYAFSHDPKAEPARALLDTGGATGLQNLNEFANVARRKLRMTYPDINMALADLTGLCTIIEPIDRALHRQALKLANRYGFAFFDALVVAAALRAACDTFWSEDMHDGLVVEGVLTIRNPFR